MPPPPPHCRQPLATDPFRDSPTSVAVIFLLASMEPIHQQIVCPIPCCLTAFHLILNKVLSKAPSISRNAPCAIVLCSTASFVNVTTFCSIVSLDFPGW